MMVRMAIRPRLVLPLLVLVAMLVACGDATGSPSASEAPPSQIYVDKTTYRRLGNRYAFSEPQDLMFKGKGRMTVYQLLGRRAA